MRQVRCTAYYVGKNEKKRQGAARDTCDLKRLQVDELDETKPLGFVRYVCVCFGMLFFNMSPCLSIPFCASVTTSFFFFSPSTAHGHSFQYSLCLSTSNLAILTRKRFGVSNKYQKSLFVPSAPLCSAHLGSCFAAVGTKKGSV